MLKRIAYSLLVASLGVGSIFGWNLTARAGYESADYEVIESDGKFEIREYPDLMLASTRSGKNAQGRDGSFMKLFRYISGANESQRKISMTTPVFMENGMPDADVQMGFVMPKQVAEDGVPTPSGQDVNIRIRKGGRFAVIRFSGVLNNQLAKENEVKLRAWITDKEYSVNDSSDLNVVESAAYDPPFTPGPLRRNEVLIRLQ